LYTNNINNNNNNNNNNDNNNTANNNDDKIILNNIELQRLCEVSSGGAPIMINSILGSFLSQEVIKGVSLTGTPAFNVFEFSCENFVAKAFPVV
jgi:hypothetical protein